jgi:hypothetical protein
MNGKRRKFPALLLVSRMIEKSARGIYYDLHKTEYKARFKDTVYCFSSAFNRDKFIELVTKNRVELSALFVRRYKCHIPVDSLADVALYSKIEKRGFLIYIGREGEKCQEMLRCAIL